MAQFGISSGRFWRQIASCIAIYALVLQGLITGLAGPQTAPFTASAGELCLHSVYDGDGAAVPAELPADRADHGVHCPFCLLGSQQAQIAPVPSAPILVAADAARVFWPADSGSVSSAADYLSNPPRGPPASA